MSKSIVDVILEYIKSKTNIVPETGVILSSGFEDLLDSIEDKVLIKYTDIPGFDVHGTEKEKGHFVVGKIAGKGVIVMDKRLHYHNGYKPAQLGTPIYVMKELGCKRLIISCSVGALSTKLKVGDIVTFTDQINLSSKSPLMDYSEMRYGHKFIDMSKPFDLHLIDDLIYIAKSELAIKVKKAIFLELMGPNGETVAESTFAKQLGASVVGFNVACEVIACKYCGLPVITMGLITNYASAYSSGKIKHEDIEYNRKCASSYYVDMLTTYLKHI